MGLTYKWWCFREAFKYLIFNLIIMNLIFCRYKDDENLVYQEKDVVHWYVKRVDVPCTVEDVERVYKLNPVEVKTIIKQVLDDYLVVLWKKY